MQLRVHIYGLPRSGTNAIAALIRRNFADRLCHVETPDHLGYVSEWKHGPIVHERFKPDRRYVIVHKHPLVWLVSFWEFLRSGADWANWNRADWHADFRVWITRPWFGHATPIDWWIQQHRQWLDYAPSSQTVWVPHHELVSRPIAVLERVAAAGLSRTGRQWELLHEYVTVNERPVGDWQGRSQDYERRFWTGYYTEKTRRIVLSRCDPVVLERLGYQLRAPDYLAAEQ